MNLVIILGILHFLLYYTHMLYDISSRWWYTAYGARPPGWRMGGSTESAVDQHIIGEENSDFKPPTALQGKPLSGKG